MREQKALTVGATKLTLNPAEKGEWQLCYTQQGPENAACIGHLRGDFGSNGQSFYSTWWPHHEELKSKPFLAEFDRVVNGLRQMKLLGSFDEMCRALNKYLDAKMQDQWRSEAAFRVETQRHTYFLRCIPQRGDYNFYLYAFDKPLLREIQREQRGLPKRCWSTLKSTGEAIEIHYGESGYTPLPGTNQPGVNGAEVAEQLNRQYGFSKAQVAAMEAGSMFGWSVPAANAHNYDENGLPLPPKGRPIAAHKAKVPER